MKNYKMLKVTFPFGEKYDPFNKNIGHPEKWEMHRGIDFRPNDRREVWAGFDSNIRVISKGEREGNYIQMMLKINKIFFYINIFHLARIGYHIKEIDEVKEDSVIAMAGNTGSSTAIHIHYEIFTYNLDSEFVKKLMLAINYVIIDEIPKKRIFFDAMKLYDYCKLNKYI